MTGAARSRALRAAWAITVASSSTLFSGCTAERGTIGALIAQTPDRRLVLREVPARLAADRAGLRAGDEVLLIDGRDVRELSAHGVHQALSGEVGDSVKLTLIRDGRVLRVTLRRTPPPKKA